ncbi:hypothetical protein [Phenylobacterium sp.]|uniref:hypothetical protein n=1 Tax=Phenylobacterium sp. TaxID=1871053 RepID=UPI00356B3D08
MSSISPISSTPPSIPLTPVKPVQNDQPPVAAAPDQDDDQDDSPKVTAAKPPGMGGLVDVKA